MELVASLHRSNLISNKVAVLLALCKHTGETEDSGVWVSCSRSELSGALGLTAKQVSNAISALARDGILSPLVTGHKGAASVYRLCIGTTPEVVPTGTGQDLREKGTTPRGSTYGPIGTTPEVVPNRTTESSSIDYFQVDTGSAGDTGRGFKRPAPIIIEPLPHKEGETLASILSRAGDV